MDLRVGKRIWFNSETCPRLHQTSEYRRIFTDLKRNARTADLNVWFLNHNTTAFLEQKLNMGKVSEWKASYYCNSTRTWVYGHLIIYTRCVRFIENKGGTDSLDFRISYENFFELKKETTSIFFAAITIRVRTDKYWFSSLSDRGHVFNMIEHFWKERLFGR